MIKTLIEEFKDELDVLINNIVSQLIEDIRNGIRNDVESVDVDGKAFTRTSDIDNLLQSVEENYLKEE